MIALKARTDTERPTDQINQRYITTLLQITALRECLSLADGIACRLLQKNSPINHALPQSAFL